MTGPIVKWVGGKGRLLDELSARMPASYRNYVEPFVGGGALYFRTRPERAYLGDANADLIGVYRVLVRRTEDLISALDYHQEEHAAAGADHYYGERTRWNARVAGELGVLDAARFLYLNRTCFNGLYRVNKRGEFNVPAGRYSNPRICDPDNLRAAAKLLATASLHVGGYTDLASVCHSGDFAYFDPPYDVAEGSKSFTAYTASGFACAEQANLASWARRMRDRGVYVMLSNADTPYVRQLYEGFQIEVVRCGRSINSNKDARGAVDELIILGY